MTPEPNPGWREARAAFESADAGWEQPDLTPYIAALNDWAAEVAALADLELPELIRQEGNR
jgi:hypothetical protein